MRFSAPFLGSSAVAGRFDPRLARAPRRRRPHAGRRRCARRASIPRRSRRSRAAARSSLGYLEVHIEQGPVLLAGGPAGRHRDVDRRHRAARMVTITGTAGPCRHRADGAARHDAAAAAAEIVLYVERRCAQAPTLVGTVGQLAVPGGAINIIPGRCELSLDIRAADDATRDAAVADVLARDRAHRGSGAASTIESREVQRTAAVALLAAPAGAARRGRGARRDQAALSCERRRPRRHDVRRPHRPRACCSCAAATAASAIRRARPSPPRTPTSPRASCSMPFSGWPTSAMTLADDISAFVDREFARETEFLAELVKVPSDNPPGDCAPHAARARELLERLGLTVEAHAVPRSAVEAAGMKSATNLIVRHRFGDGPMIALNAHGDVVPPGLGWRHDPYGARDRGRPARAGHVRARRGGVEIGFRHLYLGAARAAGRGRAGRQARRHARAAFHLRRGGRRRSSGRNGCSIRD